MLISEAVMMLQPYGVERIAREPIAGEVWRVTQNGEDYIYAAPLERVVWALTPEDEEG